MSEPQNGRGALFAGGLAAILASTCCLGPLVLVALGFSGAWIGNLTVLEPYRPIFIGAALVAGGAAAGGGEKKLEPALSLAELPFQKTATTWRNRREVGWRVE